MNLMMMSIIFSLIICVRFRTSVWKLAQDRYLIILLRVKITLYLIYCSTISTLLFHLSMIQTLRSLLKLLRILIRMYLLIVLILSSFILVLITIEDLPVLLIKMVPEIYLLNLLQKIKLMVLPLRSIISLSMIM